MDIEKYISPFIESQFPLFYREEGQVFIDFMKAYYEWMENSGNILFVSRSLLEYRDLDKTLDNFLIYFKNKYINGLPENILADKKLLIKHILDLYRSKGAEASYKLLFRMIFNEDIDIYVPSNYIFKLSDNDWTIPRYIEVSDNPYLKNLIGNKIYSSSTISTALVENYFTKQVNGKVVNVLLLSNIFGNFKYGEQIYCENIPEITNENAPLIFGSLTTVSITNGGLNYNIGDELIVQKGGVEGIARVSSIRDRNGEVTFTLFDGGSGFSLDAVVSVAGKALPIKNITSTNPVVVETKSNHTLNSSDSLKINYVQNMEEINNGGYAYSDTTVVANSTGFSNTNDTIYISNANTRFKINDRLYYEVPTDNTAISPLTGNSYYYISFANTSAIKLASSVGGANINITDSRTTNPGESHKFYIKYSTPELYYANVINSTSFELYTNQILTQSLDGSSFTTYSTVDGGYIYINTGGEGASFEIGSLVNKEIYYLNTDIIDDYYFADIETHVSGYTLDVSNINGTFNAGDVISMNDIDVREIDCQITNISVLDAGETLSNTSLGIANLTVLFSDESNILVKGSDINNSNLVSGIFLISTGGSELLVNNLYPVMTVNATANVVQSNSTSIDVNWQTGYFYAGETVYNQNSVSNAVITEVIRNDNWNFPIVGVPDLENLDSRIGDVLIYVEKEVGTIASLTNINPGEGYALDPDISVIEPLIYQLQLDDGFNRGTYKGFNSIIQGNAGFGTGIVTSIKIIDSGYGYERDMVVSLRSEENPYSVTGRSVVDSTGIGKGYWKNKKSFLSDEIRLQDSDYYQNYSYEIISSKMLNVYEKYFKELVHPVGMKLFGRFALKNEFEEEISLIYSDFRGNIISITSDNDKYSSDTTSITSDLFNFKYWSCDTDLLYSDTLGITSDQINLS